MDSQFLIKYLRENYANNLWNTHEALIKYNVHNVVSINAYIFSLSCHVMIPQTHDFKIR